MGERKKIHPDKSYGEEELQWMAEGMGKKTEQDVLQRGFRESAIGGGGELG